MTMLNMKPYFSLLNSLSLIFFKYNDLIFKTTNIYGYKTKIENANLILSMENILEGWLGNSQMPLCC